MTLDELVVLFVDDEAEVLYPLLQQRLEGTIPQVTVDAVTRTQDIELFLSKKHYHLAFVDLYMPELKDGLQAIETVRDYDVPIIALSGSDLQEDTKIAMKAGAYSFIHKNHIFEPEFLEEINDVLKKHQREQARKKEHEKTAEKLYYLYQHMDEILFEVSEEGKLLDINPAFERILGYKRKDWINKPILSLFPKEEKKNVFSHYLPLLRGEKKTSSFCVPLFDVYNKKHIFRITSILKRNGKKTIYGFATDITKEKKLEEELYHTQKFESLGRLAGGVAHDFNNILTAILGNAQIARIKNRDPSLSSYIENIEDAVNQAKAITQQLLSFSRKDTPEAKVLALHDVIPHYLKTLERMIGEDIDLQITLPKKVAPLYMDETHLYQILMNLFVNARDAMPNGGKLFFEVRNEEFIKKIPPLEEMPMGNYVALHIKDTGCGIPKNHLEHIFEPFYTTKEKGKGIGMGLATVYALVKQYGGFIMVKSKKHQGTSFTLYFPAYESKNIFYEKKQSDSSKKHESSLEQRNVAILLAEDETNLRILIKKILTLKDYKVYAFEDGEKAYTYWKDHKEELDLLLTDVIMPKMNGSELGKRIKQESPHFPIIYMSGYPDDLLQERLDEPITKYLRKPVSMEDLYQTIEETLKQKKTENYK